ncbi:hypothetical protein AVT62_gp05 [Streptomyces phage TP1604]|uniref:Uncharacterized protein n=3 Tax=Woodruffvirus TP1604 TaxID=1982746 RepID=A0A1P8VVU7_9CAUD|nr:hypothetical protein AVT62_gp05 [Streptomyces phage TP1604]AKA61743.1 hypothetical protein SEA_TP1604_5 [Streptomyces phage TP1604]APZ82173.1 hypothetical protein SEA_BABYGOTBAC_5 [Streptomyces phage BabyGotBac]AWN08365.1 hypothetical protein SEA_BAYC_5 [Streptomyces phage BayC]USH45380.1 hypothetical protein SEA_ASIS_5 [Streptomyces phage Asis]
MVDTWDDWFGQLTLTGIDPRTWDTGQMLAAFEATLRQNSKDEAAWNRTLAALTAEPPEVRAERREAVRAAAAAGVPLPESPGRMSVDDAEALLARFAASDAQYG